MVKSYRRPALPKAAAPAQTKGHRISSDRWSSLCHQGKRNGSDEVSVLPSSMTLDWATTGSSSIEEKRLVPYRQFEGQRRKSGRMPDPALPAARARIRLGDKTQKCRTPMFSCSAEPDPRSPPTDLLQLTCDPDKRLR
jgi:hypothetical protein